MSTKSYTLIPYHLRDHNVQSQTKSFFPLHLRGIALFWRPKKTIFGCRYGLPDFIFLFLFELGTCVQNLIFTKAMEGCQKNYFPQRGILKFTYKGRFLRIKMAYEKFLDWKSKRWKYALVPLLHIEIFISEKHLNLDFWWYFKVSSLGKFWQILAVLGKFSCIHNGWEQAQTWAEIFKSP
jgi:hypothetical protein